MIDGNSPRPRDLPFPKDRRSTATFQDQAEFGGVSNFAKRRGVRRGCAALPGSGRDARFTAAAAVRLVVGLLVLLVTLPLDAVIFYSTANPEYNTTAPTDSLEDSGWQFQGLWGAYLGTVISSNAFLSAQHIGGTVGATFHLDGVSYTSTAFFDDPETDLRVVRVCGMFPAAATLHTNQTEPGEEFIVFGRGTQRGAAVTTGVTNDKTNGWRWGVFDSRLRWGENTVDSIVDGDPIFEANVGELLKAGFTADAGSNECHLSVGDSGGGLFIMDGAWQLAGVNYSVDGPYNTSSEGAGFNAAIFDEGGLYQLTAGVWSLTPDLPIDQSGAFYATRVAARIDWINSVLEEIAAEPDLPTLQSAAAAAGPFVDHAAAVDPANHLISVPQPDATQFFRLRGCQSFRITGVEVVDGNLLLSYE
jgi:hypothetical protein